MSVPTLPTEIILQVIESLCPHNPRIILPPWHEITVTLFSFARVCRATRRHANKLLRRHCVYIDSGWRAKALVNSLTSSTSLAGDMGARLNLELQEIENIFLSPFPKDADNLDPIQQQIQQPQVDAWRARREEERNSRGRGRPDNPDDSDSQSGSGSSNEDWPLSPLQDYSIACDVRNILQMLAPSIKKLTIDIDLRSLGPENDPLGIKQILREGFHTPSTVEEFVSVRDELYLSLTTPSSESELDFMSTHWPNLRYLSLYNVCIDLYQFWRCLARIPLLEVVIFPRSDPFDTWTEVMRALMKREWVEALSEARGEHYDKTRFNVKPLTLVHINMGNHVRSDLSPRSWPDPDPDPNGCIRVVELWLPDSDLEAIGQGLPITQNPNNTGSRLSSGSTCPIQGCQDWVLKRSLDDTLWKASTNSL